MDWRWKIGSRIVVENQGYIQIDLSNANTLDSVLVVVMHTHIYTK